VSFQEKVVVSLIICAGGSSMKILKFSLYNIQKYSLACGAVLLFSTSLFAGKDGEKDIIQIETKKDSFDTATAEEFRRNQDYKNLEAYLERYLHGKHSSTNAYDFAKNAVESHYDPCVFYNLWRNYIHGLESSTPSREYSVNILGWLIVFNVLHMADVKCCVSTNHVYRSCDKDVTLRFELMQKNYKHRFDYYKKKIAIDYSAALEKAQELFSKIDYAKLPRPIWPRYIKNTALFSTWVSFDTPSKNARKFFSIKQVRKAVNRLRLKVFNDMWMKLETCKNKDNDKAWDNFFTIKEVDIKDAELDVEYVDSDDEEGCKTCSYYPGECDDIFEMITQGMKKITLEELKDSNDFINKLTEVAKKADFDDLVKKIKNKKLNKKKKEDKIEEVNEEVDKK